MDSNSLKNPKAMQRVWRPLICRTYAISGLMEERREQHRKQRRLSYQARCKILDGINVYIGKNKHQASTLLEFSSDMLRAPLIFSSNSSNVKSASRSALRCLTSARYSRWQASL